ncbi:amino acid adenylation domain-containing protein [Labrys neptuniae]
MRELTVMQAAYWVGRQSVSAMGGVAAHLYAEFDQHGLDPDRLGRAVIRLGEHHPMLRLCVSSEGLQAIRDEGLCLQIDDFGDLEPDTVERVLTAKRAAKSHQRLAIELGQVCEFSLSLLPGERCRLHIDTDMIAIDPPSFRLLVEDLARCYEDAVARLEPRPATYFDYVAQLETDGELAAQRERDRAWWRSRLADIPPAPLLPPADRPAKGPHSERLAAFITPVERQALTALARHHHLTPATLMLGLFAGLLGAATGAGRFRLNVPMFYRAPIVAEVDRIIGEFSNPLILSVERLAGDTLEALCRRLGAGMNQALSHAAYPGPSLMRDLSRHRGGIEFAPVVFTAGLDIGGELFSERVTRIFGEMAFVISQGPQVALDAQVASADGGILINWDVRLDAVEEGWVRALFAAYVDGTRALAMRPEAMQAPADAFLAGLIASQPAQTGKTTIMVTDSTPERGLTPLQRAYLLGRGEQLPLGGVAMQEFRDYRGSLDLEAFKARLQALVRNEACLRTLIDADGLSQRVSDEARLNLDEVDLRHLPPIEAWQRIDAMREDFAHRLHDLTLPPWHITLFRLPEPQAGGGNGDTTVVFARFDALIVDGRAIASILRQLFSKAPPLLQPRAPAGAMPSAGQRQADAAYWAAKLDAVTDAPKLPWQRPLETIRTSRYQRLSLTVAREALLGLTRIGAAHNLFRHAVLTAVILETLSHWVSEGSLCVGVPVALPTAMMGNESTFIIIDYHAGARPFAESARLVQQDTLEGLEHLAFSGVDIARLLMNRNPAGPALPVVITNGLSWEAPETDSPMRWHDGLTQTPQVAMDIRMSLDAHKNLVLAIDYARQALDGAVVNDILSAIGRAIVAINRRGALELEAGDILDFGHLRHNHAPTSLESAGFLARIAHRLSVGTSDKAAVICGDKRISYAELGGQVARIIAGLRARSLGRGDVVAICLPRSLEHVMVQLACSLLGLVWVPIDVGSPPDRIAYLLENCHPALVVGLSLAPGFKAVPVDDLLAHEAAADWQADAAFLTDLSASEDAAYYLYTSGTTGKPKCVVLSNRATSNVIDHTLQSWQVTDEDVFISVTPLHHDMSVFDVYGALCAGATLVMPRPGEEKDAIGWNRLVEQHRVSLWCSVPAILEMLLACQRGRQLDSLRLIAQGGDYIKPAVIDELRRFNPALRLVSLGGPTETTIWSIWHEIGVGDTAIVPYGRPVPGNGYFILDERGNHCPPQVVGRIHTTGVNVALGYLEDGVVNQSDFVTIADESGQPVRAFRTGDLGSYRPDGTLIFAGRVNGYVKIRGVRVSLPDIENELSAHSAIKHVLVVDHEPSGGGEVALAALYVAETGDEIPLAQLRAFARERLPETHVPSRFQRLDVLPLSANGKPDRRRARQILAEPKAGEGSESARPPTASPSASARIVDIYLSVLGRAQREGFDEGGDFLSIGLRPSHLKAVAGRISGEFGVDLTPDRLVRCRNAHEVAQLLVP